MDFVNKKEGFTNYTMNDIENLTNFYNTSGGGRKKKSRRVKRARKSRRHVNQRAGGSDWGHTLYSRGPVNQPSNPDRFVMFSQEANYIPNEQLAKQGPQ